MKTAEKKMARALRRKGLSINEIYPTLRVSKSSASTWVRDIELTESQKRGLSLRGHRKEDVEKRRITRLTRENARRQVVIDKAKENILAVSKNELFLMGISLYWAEGSKTKRSVVCFSNSDPRLIQIMKKFFKDSCGIPDEKFRGHVHLHPHLDSKKAESFWSEVSGIPISQFFKTSQAHNRASKGGKDSLPYGTFNIYICSTELFLKIKGWTEKIYSSLFNSRT